MTGGTIISSNTSQTLQFNSGAQVTISEGNVINTCTTTAAKAISFTGNGTLKIEGGVIASLNGDGILCNSANGSATVTISGGYIVGKANNTRKNFAVNNSGWTVTITGGYFGTSDPSASFTTGENILMLFNGIAGISAENFDVAQKEERKVDNIGTITFYAFQANSR